MKKLKIFLAHSKELEEEYKQIDLFITQENNELVKKKIFLELVVWEKLLQSFRGERIQDYYNKEMLQCDIVIALFFKKVGRFTKEEFDIAYKNLKEGKKPFHMFVFFKDTEILISTIDEEVLGIKNLKKQIDNYEQIYHIFKTTDELIDIIKHQFDLIITKKKSDSVPEIGFPQKKIKFVNIFFLILITCVLVIGGLFILYWNEILIIKYQLFKAPKYSYKKNENYKDLKSGIEFVWIPGGSFKMGCQDKCKGYEKPIHKVHVDGFWMGKFEITQKQWTKIMGYNPSANKGDNYPVEMVSWYETNNFIQKLNDINNTPDEFRLPTEAEWEYSCRNGGMDVEYPYGKRIDLHKIAHYNKKLANYNSETTIKTNIKEPNKMGLYNMSGNVQEWCKDIYNSNAYKKHNIINPEYNDQKMISGGRVIRGGCYGNINALFLRCTARQSSPEKAKSPTTGFRIVKKP